jgi:hypothetical protein
MRLLSSDRADIIRLLHEAIDYLRNDRYVDKRGASSFLGISKRTLDSLLPTIPHYRIKKKIFFKRSELDEWMQSHRVRPTSQDLKRLADEITAKVLEEEK